ncbi:MAG: hypothetical protein R3C10_23665 [Pirellulales bacterium]
MLYHRLLLVIPGATQKQLAAYLRYLKDAQLIRCRSFGKRQHSWTARRP